MAERSKAALLTPRQLECLRLVWIEQATSKEISLRLRISKRTVDEHVASAVAALNARDRRDAALMVFGPPPIASAADPAAPDVPAAPPTGYGGDPVRVGGDVPTPAGPAGGMSAAPWWTSWVPFRTGPHNDLSIPARLFSVVFIAVVLAVGFGAFAAGVRFISDLFR